MGIAVGIDLGTSNSCVAAIINGVPTVLVGSDRERTHPSVVSFGRDGGVTVGHQARKQLAYAPGATVASAKRLIGRRFHHSEVERMRQTVGWEIIEGPDGEARVRVHEDTMAVEEVSAHVLAHVKRVAEEALGEEVDAAVITVPAYFNDQQRQATRDAATIAGLDCLRILNEPTAAALAYGFGKGKRQHIAVFDFGGGTFDISILRLDDDFFEVVSTAGDTFLGGDDIDRAITDHLLGGLGAAFKDADIGAHVIRSRVAAAAEQAKIALSTVESTRVSVRRVGKDPEGNDVDLDVELTRDQLEKLAMPIIQRSFLVVDDALSQAGMSPSQIDHVLLVGGMTRLPLIRRGVSEYFGREVSGDINPDEVVALGAAIQARNLTSIDVPQSAVLLDVTPQTLGIETAGGLMEPLIPRNTPVPTEASKLFHTANDFQTGVRVTVYQGEERQVSRNTLLGQFVLDELPAGLRGEVTIEISFAIDTDGMVQVVARDPESGRAEELRIQASGRLSATQVASLAAARA